MSITPDDLVVRIRAAFEAVPIPAEDEILGTQARNNLDALELRAVLAGKHWTAVPIDDLFYHRETVAELSAIGLRAYVAAFLVAALANDRRSPDIYEFTLFAFYPLHDGQRELARERVSLLDGEQRATIIAWLQYFANYNQHARRVLEHWQ